MLVDAYDEMVDSLFDPPPLQTGVVHGDVDPGSLLVRGGAVVGVIDCE